MRDTRLIRIYGSFMLTCWHVAHTRYISVFLRDTWRTGWRRLIGCFKLQVIFCKRATNYRALLRKMTYEYKASYVSSPPCIRIYGSFMLTCSCVTHDLFVCMAHVDMLHTRANMPHLCMWYIGAFMRDTRLIRIYGSFMSTCYTRERTCLMGICGS